MPTEEELREALVAAGKMHHEYETHALGGKRDEQWTGWYAAYVLGRLGNFEKPSALAGWLEQAPGEGDWARNAAAHVLANHGSD